jgi:tRNA(Ile2) C34 agmatinyltransferase TiaS
MKETELKPCPFCGGEANFIGETATIKCKQCGGAFIVTNPLINSLEAAQAWNRRSSNEQRTD